MAPALPLQRMSKADKLRAMEALWADLSGEAGGAVTPSWHLVELAATTAAVRAGKVAVLDWEQARKSIQRRTK